MRWLVVIIIVCASACDQGSATQPQSQAPAGPSGPSGSAGPATGPSDAAPAPTGALPTVDLLHAVPTTISVSSAWSAPPPYHPNQPSFIADGDEATAWRSAAEDLHASITIAIPPGAVATELRMTPGLTAGSGVDAYGKNARVVAIAVYEDRHSPKSVQLDMSKPALQSVPVYVKEKLEIYVAAPMPGEGAGQRSLVVSELQLWGTPPPGWTAPASPLAPDVTVVPVE